MRANYFQREATDTIIQENQKILQRTLPMKNLKYNLSIQRSKQSFKQPYRPRIDYPICVTYIRCFETFIPTKSAGISTRYFLY